MIGEGHEVGIRANLRPEESEELVKCFSNNLDVFVWSPCDILGISPSVAQHLFGILSGAKPVKQKKKKKKETLPESDKLQ